VAFQSIAMTLPEPTSSLWSVELHGLPVAGAMGVMVLLVVAAVWCYRSESTVNTSKRRALLTLRITAIVVASLLLTLPAVHVERTRTLPPKVVLVHDLSPSTDVSEGEVSRRSVLAELMSGAWRSELDGVASVEVHTFGETGTSPVLETVASHLMTSAEPGGAVIVLSDGIDTSRVDSSVTVERARASGTAVFAIAVGDPAITDLSLADASVDPVVFASDRATARLRIDSTSSFAGRAAQVEILVDGSAAGRETIRLDGTSGQRVDVELPELAAGRRLIELLLVSDVPETVDANNMLELPVRVIDRRIRVLWIEQSPRWEHRFAEAALRRDPRVEYQRILVDALKPDAPVVEESTLARVDLLILGDVHADRLGADAIDAIVRFVSLSGGALIAVAGDRAMPWSYEATPLATLLPLVADSADLRNRVEGRLERDKVNELQTTSLADDAAEDDRLWRELPSLRGVASLRLARAARTLLRIKNEAGDFSPVLAMASYGAGEVAMLASDDLWRIRRNEGDRYHARFWSQLVLRLALARLMSESPGAQLSVQPLRALPGEDVMVMLRLFDESMRPVVLARIEARMIGPDQREQSLTLTAALDAPGLYRGVVRSSESGEHTVVLEQSRSSFDILEDRREIVRVVPDHALLRRIAETTGGRFVTADRAGDLLPLIRNRATTIRARSEHPLWSNPWAFSTLLMLLSAEWFLRRRWMLR
jgi:hypothetical protein